jgi:helix-turn-helix motif
MKNRIIEFRKALNLTQRQLAEKVGITYQSLQRYEKGTVLPIVDIAIKLAEALDTTVENLFISDKD